MIPCPICHVVFQPRDRRQTCCSKKCGVVRYEQSEQRRAEAKNQQAKHRVRRNSEKRDRYKNDSAYREERVAFSKSRRAQYPEQVALEAARYRAKPENKIHAAAKSRHWHDANKIQANPRRTMRKQKERVTYPWKGPLDAARRRAQMKGLPFDLTDEWCSARWTGACEVSGIPFRIGERGAGPKFFAASLDQIIPKGGYTQKNCRFVLWAVNAFKYDGSDADIFRVAQAITQRLPATEGILSLPE